MPFARTGRKTRRNDLGRSLEEKGLRPDKVIADFGRGLRAGHQAVWPEIPCWGDVFHPLMDLSKLVRYLQGRLRKAEDKLLALEIKAARPKIDGRTLRWELKRAREKEQELRHTCEVVSALYSWLKDDILGLHGPSREDRQALFDFVVESLKQVEDGCKHRIRPVRKLLENNRDELLEFAGELDEKLVCIAEKWAVPVSVIYDLSKTLKLEPERTRRWVRQARHYECLGERYEELMDDVGNALNSMIRGSSLVENLNSRLRNYFFLRKQLGGDYLCLLQFFLNHHRYVRSHRGERQGKSPRELLTGEEHAHWLELLGFERFTRA